MKKTIALILFLLFLCSSALAEEAAKLPLDLSGGTPYSVKYNKDIQVFEDPTIRVERDRVGSKKFGCTYYYAKITIADPSQLRTLPADNRDFTSNTKVSAAKMAKRVNAVIAINGDFPGAFQGNVTNSFVLRQGKIYRGTVEPSLDLLLIDEDGDFHIIPAGEEQTSMDLSSVDGKKVINGFQFGPGLIINGEPQSDEVLLDRKHSPTHADPHQLNQRMCIAQIDTLTYLVVCCAHYGATLPTMRDIILEIAPECKNAYTLDGGNSTQMIFLGQRINNVNSDGAKDRNICDIIYFASAYQGE